MFLSLKLKKLHYNYNIVGLVQISFNSITYECIEDITALLYANNIFYHKYISLFFLFNENKLKKLKNKKSDIPDHNKTKRYLNE